MSSLRRAALVIAVMATLVAGCHGGDGFPVAVRTSGVATPAPGAPARPDPGPAATANPRPAPEAARLRVGPERHRAGVASGGHAAPYNYAPSIMVEGGRYRMWWCSQLPDVGPAGDDILYASAASPDGPFAASGKAAVPAFHGGGAGFDAKHTCDPSVIRIGGTYFLYYTGSAGTRDHGNAIGVAAASDGRHFHRLNGGRPIVLPARDTLRRNTYGAGQPSAVYLDGWVYLMFTDTTGKAAGNNGAGQFVLRSTDPTFRSGVQALTGGGFRPVGSTMAVRGRSIVDAFSADWMWVGALDAFAVAHETRAGTTITFWDRDFTRNPYQPVEIPGRWQEGPGLVRDPAGHAPPSGAKPCRRVPIDVIRATRNAAAPTGLSFFGRDVRGSDGCGTRSRALAALDGYAVVSPRRTIDIVTGGSLIEVDRRSVATRITGHFLNRTVPALAGARVAARITPGVPALKAPGRPVALLIGGKLWPVGDGVVAANSSQLRTVSARTWDSYAVGADLSALPG